MSQTKDVLIHLEASNEMDASGTIRIPAVQGDTKEERAHLASLQIRAKLVMDEDGLFHGAGEEELPDGAWRVQHIHLPIWGTLKEWRSINPAYGISMPNEIVVVWDDGSEMEHSWGEIQQVYKSKGH